MSTERLWRSLAVLLPALAAILAPMSTVDLAYHLRAGTEILATAAIPTTDTWTFTAAGSAWFDQQWGAQVIFRLVEQIGGWTGLVALRALATAVIFACLGVIAARRGLGARGGTLLVVLAFVVAAPAMALRPQLFGMVCFAIVLLLLEGRRWHPGRLWLVPIVVAVWANLHGSFFLGPLALGLTWLADVHDRAPSPRSTLLVTMASVAGACLTPAGPLVWVYAIGLSADPTVTARITEWQPTSLRTPAGVAFFASVAAAAALIARRATTVDWPTLAWLGAFVAIGLYAERGIAWWALAAAGPVAALLAPSDAPRTRPGLRPDPRGIRRVNAVIAGVLVLAGVGLLPWWRPLDPGTQAPVAVLTDAPSAITAVLREKATAEDRILNHQAWGSWLEYAVPAAPVAIDSRIELFTPETWDRYEQVMAGVDGWQAQVEAWGVTVVVLEAEATGARDRFVADGWRVLHEDEDGSILQHP
ncbi:MAG: hypothetical protein ACSLFN_03705 [Candidatus Limnocylindrales bacterium]